MHRRLLKRRALLAKMVLLATVEDTDVDKSPTAHKGTDLQDTVVMRAKLHKKVLLKTNSEILYRKLLWMRALCTM